MALRLMSKAALELHALRRDCNYLTPKHSALPDGFVSPPHRTGVPEAFRVASSLLSGELRNEDWERKMSDPELERSPANFALLPEAKTRPLNKSAAV